MPFRSEKQRRFLWAEHPDIARRWADEYPLNGKKLPMYAKDKAENSDEQPAKSEADVVKAAKDILKRIKMPTNTGPTYAGQTDISSEQASTSILDENTPKVEETPELNKCGMIPGTDNAQKWENEKARAEGRPAQRISAVPGVKRQIVPNIYNPPPMAMSAQSANSSPKPASAQSATPANDAANKLMKNTIGNFGPIAANGNLNGNAAFGVKNSPNSSKTSNYRASVCASAVEKWAFDPATASAIVGGGLGLGALGIGGAYLFGDGPNSRKGRQNAKELADYWAAQKTLKRDQHYKKQLDYVSALQAAPTEENVRNYLKHWGSKGFKRDDDWEDLEEDLPFKPFNTPGAFESDYLTDHLHTDIGNRLRDPKQFEAAFRELLPKLNVKQSSTMKSARISAPMCPCGCNEKSYNCTCPEWCACRKPGMPCAPKKRKAVAQKNDQEKTAAPLGQPIIDELLQNNKLLRNANAAISTVSPMLLNAIGKRLGFGVGPTLRLGANLGHAGVAHGLNIQQKMLRGFQTPNGITKQNAATKYARYGARSVVKGVAENAENEGGLDPTAAALVALLGAGGVYAALYGGKKLLHGGKKLLSPVARRMGVSTLAPEDVGQFSLPVAGGNEYAFAERYRQPNMLGSLFADSDADAVSNALMHMAKKVPGSAARLERHSEQPSLEPRDLDFVGKYLVNEYPHRYRNTTVKSALMTGGRHQFSAPAKTAASSPAWQRAAGKNDAGGLNAKGRASYNRATGGNLKAPVTESNPKGERKSRRSSFCARMGGMKKKLTGKDTANDPDSRINKALRKWNCKSGEEKKANVEYAGNDPAELKWHDDMQKAVSAWEKKWNTKWKDYPPKTKKKQPEVGQKNLKTSAYKGISEFSGMPGPDQISHAVSQLGMLKALVRPDDSILKQRGITRSGFQSGLRDIYNHSRNKDRFELSELAPQPNTHAALGGLGGLGAAGLLGYAGVRDPAVLAGTAVIPAVAAYFRARNKRHNLLNTAKLVKDYGLLRPKLLRQAYPLLAADD